MKKLLALTLALAMVLSMAAVSFAVTERPVIGIGYYEEAEYYGDSTYYVIGMYDEEEDDFYPLVDSDLAKKLKVKASFTSGEEYVDSVSIVKDVFDGYVCYAIEIATKDAPTLTKSKDVIGEVVISSSKYNFFDMDEEIFNEKELKLQVAFSLSNKDASDVKGQDKRDETMNGWYVYNFDGIEDEEYEFELYGDMGRFVVDTIGQGKLVIKTNVKYNSGIENADPDVNYVYFNGNNATFNKIGELYLNAEEGNFIYKRNADDTLTKLDVPYDEDEEAFVVRTRVIGSYVISEEELNVEEINAAVLASKEETAAPEAMVPANPATGAAC